MNEKIRKIINGWLASIVAICASVPVFAVCNPVLADTTYYSYDYYSLYANGVTIYGLNLPVSRCGIFVAQGISGNDVRLIPVFYIFSYSDVSSASAQDNFENTNGSASNLTALSKSSTGDSWTYGSTYIWNNGSFSFNISDGTTRYFYYAFIAPLNASTPKNSLGAYAPTGTDLVTYNGGINIPISEYLSNYLKYKIFNVSMDNNYTIGSFTGGWVSSGTTNIPAIDMDSLNGGSNPGSTIAPDATPEPTSNPDNGNGSGGSSSSGSLSQSQSMSIAEGAIAFTVADGAFQNTNTQSQTIEENAINVTVNNENGVTQENSQYLNNVINNNLGENGNTFEQAIGTISGFTGIARSFATLAGAVLGFLPSWVLSLLAITISLLLVMIVFRLIHLFV